VIAKSRANSKNQVREKRTKEKVDLLMKVRNKLGKFVTNFENLLVRELTFEICKFHYAELLRKITMCFCK